jgi:hypothetical protein
MDDRTSEAAGAGTWTYELDDGAPVNSSLHGPGAQLSAPVAPGPRMPFGDVTLNFAEYYAPFLDSAADLKSPDRNGRRLGASRFSPNRPPGSGAAKKLVWNKDLPPLPRATHASAIHDQTVSGLDLPTLQVLRAAALFWQPALQHIIILWTVYQSLRVLDRMGRGFPRVVC